MRAVNPARAEVQRGTAFEARATANIDHPETHSPNFDGPPRSGVPVMLYGPFRGCRSIENVCTQIARQLLAAIPGTALCNYGGPGFFDPDLEPFEGCDRRAPIAIVYGGGPDFVPEFFFEHGVTIGGFVCETDRIPSAWVQKANRFDLVLVPSRFCLQAFRRSGVTVPMLLVPHGVEPEYYPRRAKQRAATFRFYHISSGSMAARKGLPELIRCFRRAFADRPQVQLVLRVDRDIRVLRALVAEGVRMNDPQIRLQPPSPLSTDAFAALYSEMHCTVHPAKGEGFGLIPMQSIACETPVIAPCATGLADYLDADNAMVLRTHGRDDDPEVYYECGSYPLLDEEHLVELLRYAEAHWESEYERVRRVAPAFREAHRWPSVLAELLALIRQLVGAESTAACRELIQAHARLHDDNSLGTLQSSADVLSPVSS